MLIVLEGHNVHMHFLVQGTQYPVHILQAECRRAQKNEERSPNQMLDGASRHKQ